MLADGPALAQPPPNQRSPLRLCKELIFYQDTILTVQTALHSFDTVCVCLCVYIAGSSCTGIITLMKSWQAFDLIITSTRRKSRADHRDVRGGCLSCTFLIPLEDTQSCIHISDTHTHTAHSHQHTPHHVQGTTLYIPGHTNKPDNRLITAAKIRIFKRLVYLVVDLLTHIYIALCSGPPDHSG